MNRPTDPNTLVAALSRDQVSLELGTFDLCCLAGLYLRADRDALASFAEDTVVDLFEQVCDMVEPGADNPRKRATHAIQRLRDQRMLARVDGAGVVTAARLTPSSRATCAFVIPPATMAAHRVHRSDPVSRFGSGATSSARLRCSRG